MIIIVVSSFITYNVFYKWCLYILYKLHLCHCHLSLSLKNLYSWNFHTFSPSVCSCNWLHYFLKLRYYCFTTLLKNLLRLNTLSLQIANVILLAKLCMCACYSSVLNKNNFKLREKLKERKQQTSESDGQK